MLDRAELRNYLESEIQTAQAQTAAREMYVSNLLVKTGEQWRTWDAHWQGDVQLLEQCHRDLEVKKSEATGIVAVGEGKLDETEAALCDWLATAQHLAGTVPAR